MFYQASQNNPAQKIAAQFAAQVATAATDSPGQPPKNQVSC